MRNRKLTNKFVKQYRKMLNQGKDNDKIDKIMAKLINEERLEEKHNEHKLKGNWKGFNECHIETDWLLVYRIDEKNNTIIFEGTGSHSELFG